MEEFKIRYTYLVPVEGKVYLNDEVITEKTIVNKGDKVSTGEKGKAKIEFPDNSVSRLAEDSELIIQTVDYDEDTNETDVLLKLTDGEVWSKVVKLVTQDNRFEVETETTVVAVRGSAFNVAIDEDGKADYYYLEDVPWAMYFDEARAFHGAYWHNGYGYERSHGCVNMSPGDAQWLFNWADVGDWVWVHDPSGLTPTDPTLYTAGGA